MKKKFYILTAIISYLVLLIATVPAKPVTDYINENTDVIIKGVSGSIWDGNAYSIDINGVADLGKTVWSFNLWKLFIGQISATASTQYYGNEISTEAGLSLTGRIHLNNLTAKISAKQLADVANIPLVQLDGMISMNIESAQWKQGELPVANGVIIWNDAVVSVAEQASLGDVSITLSESDQETITANISNKGGDIIISGNAELIPQENYAVDLKFTPTATAKDSLKQSLGLFAKKQNNGDFLLKNTGSINQFGLM